jgi:hypothetical protein
MMRRIAGLCVVILQIARFCTAQGFVPGEYVVGPNDVLAITVVDQAQLTGKYIVRASYSSQLSAQVEVDVSDEAFANLTAKKITGVLNVAQDLQGTRGWHSKVEYMQVGLINGPGNELSAYTAAVLALSALLRRGNVLVCCHDADRSLAVVIMYLIAKRGKRSDNPGLFNRWTTWDDMLDELIERVARDGRALKEPHESHRAAADNLPMSLFEQIL